VGNSDRALAILHFDTPPNSSSIEHFLSKYPNIEKLELSSTVLEGMVQHLTQLTNLRELKIQGYPAISALLDGFSNLQTIEILNLSDNEFTEFLPQLCQLSRLKQLNLSHDEDRNSLMHGSIPMEIANLTQLQELDINHAAITEFGILIVDLL
jgi:Leucine-rich repeat (LRR) protein